MTYKELAALINKLPANRQDDDVAIFLNETDETFPAVNTFRVGEDSSLDGVLDRGHFVIEIVA